MKEEQKIYIRGVYNRGKEVIKILEDYGASNPRGYIGDYDRALYFINHDNIIDCTRDHDAEFAKIIMDNYKEIELPEKWKDGNILTACGKNFCIFQDYSENFPGMFRAYINFETGLQLTDDKLYDKDYYRLATEDEIAYFYNQLHKRGKDWDSKKKQLINWKWKPKNEEDYWTIIVGITIYMRRYTWTGSAADEIRYELGNCFRTSDEADAMLKKVKLLFNKE